MTTKSTATVPIEVDEEDERDAELDSGKTDGDADGDKPDKAADKGKAKPVSNSSPALRQIQQEEDASLKTVLDGLGEDGSFRIGVFRLEPEEWVDPVSGRRVKTSGKLRSYTSKVDEDVIADKHGGGKYQLRFMRRDSKGSYKFFTQRTVEVAGDPRVDDIPRTTAVAPGGAVIAGENPTLVKEVFRVMTDQLERANDREREPKETGHRGIDPAMQMMLEQMRADGQRRDEENAELRRDLAAMRNQKPPEDPLKDKLLESMIGGERGHVEALRLRHESELRQAKDAAAEDQKRLYDRHDRDLAQLRSSHEREIASIRASNEVALASMKSSYEIQVKVLESDIRRLERDNNEHRADVKDLRQRKDKTIVETAKELEAVRSALGLDDGGDKSNFDKFLEVATSPAAAEFVQRVLPQGGAAPAAQPAQAQAQAQQPRGTRQLVRDPNGQTFVLVTDGKGQQQLVPVKKKPKVIPATTNPDGTVVTPEIVLPDVDPASVALVVSYLERSFAARQEPEIVAQSGRTSVPEEILTWIRANDGEAVSGVDLFMSKVAKLPSTSPLATQLGKNWLRKVGKALVGE